MQVLLAMVAFNSVCCNLVCVVF